MSLYFATNSFISSRASQMSNQVFNIMIIWSLNVARHSRVLSVLFASVSVNRSHETWNEIPVVGSGSHPAYLSLSQMPSLRIVYAYKHQCFELSVIKVMACRLSHAKLLPEQMLQLDFLTIALYSYHHRGDPVDSGVLYRFALYCKYTLKLQM